MKQKPTGRPSSSDQIIRDIKRKTRKQYGAEEKNTHSAGWIAWRRQYCRALRREGIAQSLYYKWSKDFMEPARSAWPAI